MTSADIDAAIVALRGERAAYLASASLSMILKYDQTIRENTMSVNGLYNSRSELDPGTCRRGGFRVAKGAGKVDANSAAEEASMDARGGGRYDEVYARAQ
jgi:hypothetical protein